MLGCVDARQGDDVPGLRLREVVGDDVGASSLHVKGEEAGRRADIENAFPGQRHVAEVGLDAGTKIPFALDHAVAGDRRRMIEVAGARIGRRGRGQREISKAGSDMGHRRSQGSLMKDEDFIRRRGAEINPVRSWRPVVPLSVAMPAASRSRAH